jgi:hypothetical protein
LADLGARCSRSRVNPRSVKTRQHYGVVERLPVPQARFSLRWAIVRFAAAGAVPPNLFRPPYSTLA